MKILAIDSSGLVASVAIMQDNVMVAEYTTNFKKTHSQTLLPMLDDIVKMVDLDLKEIDAIAVAAGPGSFTGLRIGSATAKGLGLALKKPIVAIPTVEGLAANLFATDALVCPIMDAKRHQVYTGIFEFVNGELKTVVEQKAVSIDEILEELLTYNRKVIFLGDGVEVNRDTIETKMKDMCLFAPAHLSKQRAGAIASRAAVYLKEGKTQTAMEHVPVYLRLSQAERELAEKNKAKGE
ncbi:TsaB protein [Lachnospiraceae bacterium KM106-2]|nr:TsaB protein [Lachnospiraceae bacterium KM106-2]